MINGKSLRVFLYIRVSTQEQAREGYSIGAQEERLRAYASAKGYTVVKVYTDPAFSGANLNRPALQEMLKQIENGAVDLVLVYKLDRLSRSQKDTLYLIEEVFLKNEVDFVSMNESFDTSTPFGRAMIGILSVFAQLEREQIRERAMMGKEARAKEGKWHGGGGESRVVTGYDYIDGELVINEFEAECVRTVFAEYNKGCGAAKIFKKMEQEFPGVIRYESTVRKILTNPLYTGKVRFKDSLFEGVHDPIIDEQLFMATQNLMEKRAVTANPFRKQYLLSGLVFCGVCGARMFGRTGGKLKSGGNMKYYICYSRHRRHEHMVKDHKCTKRAERKEALEEDVIAAVKKVNARFVENLRTGREDNTPKIKTLEKEIKQIDKQIAKLVDLYSLDNIPLEIMAEKTEKLKGNRAKLVRHMEEIKSRLVVGNAQQVKDAISMLPTFDWDNADPEMIRLILVRLVKRINVVDSSFSIEWAF